MTYDPDKTTPQAIAASVSKTGFETSVKKPPAGQTTSAADPVPGASVRSPAM